MIYTPMTNIALRICFDAHKDQVDKAGAPYVFHPFHLAEQMRGEATCCAALLHDVVEDTDTTFDGLLAAGISEPVVDALRLLTHDPQVEYLEYVRAIRSNPIARAVKLADLRHNSDESRFAGCDGRDGADVAAGNGAGVVAGDGVGAVASDGTVDDTGHVEASERRRKKRTLYQQAIEILEG